MRKFLWLLVLIIFLSLGLFFYQRIRKQRIWHPKPGTSWQWQLSGEIDDPLDVDMYDIDLFDSSKDLIKKLHREGIVVICYFSAGSYEDWRPDHAKFPKDVLGKKMQDWDELWLDISKLKILAPIMVDRLELARNKGCDGVEPDNLDGYQNKTGFKITAKEQLAYNKFLAKEAHTRGLSIGLKNDLDQIDALVDYFDWALNEQCFEYEECHKLLPFIKIKKAVFGVEYELEPEQFCHKANKLDFDWLYKHQDLDSFRIPCR